jgi:hypothetical protein
MILDAVNRLCSKGSQPSAKHSIMLGAIAGVCARQSDAKKILSTQKPDFFSFYNREIMGSRIPVPAHIANGLADFFLEFTTREDLEKEIVPSLEKALLRAPEIVLNDVVISLFRSLPDSIDLSTVLRYKLLKPLLSSIKSTNANIRQGALAAFKAAVPKCHDMDAVLKIAEDFLAPLKSGKLPSDQKLFHAEMVGVLPVSRSICEIVGPTLAVIAGKETNDAALGAETSAMLNYLEWGALNGMDLEKPVIDAFIRGVSDKKVSTRRLWTIRLGELLWSIDPDVLKSKYASLVESSIPALIEMWNEVTINPISAALSGLVTSAFILTATAQKKLAYMSSSKVDAALKKAQIAKQALTMEPKPSFLLNPRVYGKLSSDDDLRWLIRALSSLSEDLAPFQPDSAVALGWSQAIIFCICSSTIKPALRKDASNLLSKMYVRNPAYISNVIIAGLWQWRNSLESSEKDNVAAMAKTENQHLHIVVKSICLSPAEASQIGAVIDQSILKNQMISMLVISRPELLPHVNWIELCLRAGIDPGELARTSGELLIQQILDLTTFNEKVINSVLQSHTFIC